MNVANDSIRVGVLLSPTTDHESALLRGTLLGIATVNENGGVLGKKLSPYFGDPRGNATLATQLVKRFILVDRVSHIFGSSHSHIRKALAPVVERHQALLWYPNHFEGFEYSPNVVYCGTCPNQSVVPLFQYLCSKGHGSYVLLGSDYIYSREVNRVARQFIEAGGGKIIAVRYVEPGFDVSEVRKAVSNLPKSDVIFSSILAPNAVVAYRILNELGIQTPIASVGINEFHLSGAPDALRGHISSAPYFESIDDEANTRFLRAFHKRFGTKARASWCAANAFMQVLLFAQTAERARSVDVSDICRDLGTGEVDGPFGRCRIDPETNYVYGFSRVGIANQRGHFDIVFEAAESIRPDPFLVAHA